MLSATPDPRGASPRGGWTSVEPAHGDAPLLSPEMLGRLGRLAIAARKIVSARRSGRRRTRRVGCGLETIDLRPYDPGDDTRRIAWHAYARLERLLVRLVADEAPLRLTIVVDESASMKHGSPTKLRHAARVAAGFAAVALGGEDRVALAAGSSASTRVVRSVSGRAGLSRLLRALDGLAAAGTTDVAGAVRACLDGSRGRGACVIVSDLLEHAGVLAGAREARRRGEDVVVVEVLSPFEIDPPDLSGFDLEDEESGELVELAGGDPRDAYRAALAAHRTSVDEAARSIEAAVVRTTTAEPFERLVTRALAAGVLLGGSR